MENLNVFAQQETKEITVFLRLTKDELTKLDRHGQGQLSRSQIVRAVLQDYLDRPEEEQREILFRRLFGGT